MNKEIVQYASDKKMILTEDALRLLNIYNYKQIIDNLEKENKIFVSYNDIKKNIEELKIKNNNNANLPDIKNFFILDKYDVTGKKLSQGKVDDFLKLFIDKYNSISEIIKTRVDFEYIKISDAQNLPKNKKVDIIGMIYEKRKSKNDNFIITVDDLSGKVSLVINSKDPKLNLEANNLLLDNVIGFKCSVLSKDMFIVNEIIYPDIPFVSKQSNLTKDTYLAVISDVHVGSKLFLEKEFLDFIDWLNFKNSEDEEIIKNLKYLVIAGDLVDGVGIYPSQFDELLIPDIFKQYELFEDYILRIPKNIEIFISPGNHDAVRLSDPQPAIPETFFKRLYHENNIHLIGSPSVVEIEGYNCLIYHGSALIGIYTTLQDMNMEKPDLAIKEVLKRRDLMPQFGQKQTFMPIEKNFMVIKQVPDIYIGGDVHTHAYSKYKGCHILNGSCWQSITNYQIELGHHPTYAKVLLFNLKTQKLIIKDFESKKQNIQI
ncbi:MAG: metallophosphoesterase [archaeon]